MNLRLIRKRAMSEDSLRKQRDVTTAKEEALLKEANAKTWSVYVETIRKTIPVIAMGYGLVAAFVYFFLSANFFPSGVTTGDALLFIFIALGYALLSVLFVAFGFWIAAIPTITYQNYRPKDSKTSKNENHEVLLFLSSGTIPVLLGAFLYIGNKLLEFSEGDIKLFSCACGLSVLLLLLIARRLGAGYKSKTSIKEYIKKVKKNPIKKTIATLFRILRKKISLKILFKNIIDALDMLFHGFALAAGWFSCLLLIYIFDLSAIPIIVTTFIASFFAWFGLSLIEKKELDESKLKMASAPAVFLSISLIIPLFVDATINKGRMINYVFSGLGLRVDGATVRLNGAGLASVRDAARNAGAKLAICTDSDGSATVSPVNIVWHGMGKRSLISLEAPNEFKDKVNPIELEVASDELRLIRGINSRCQDISTQVFFQSNKDKISTETQLINFNREVLMAVDVIKKMSCQIKTNDNSHSKCRWRLAKILVTGSADPMAKSDGGNEGLAMSRAQYLVNEIIKKDGIHSMLAMDQTLCITESLGSRAVTQKQCPISGDKDSLVECHAGNRSGKARLLFVAYFEDKENKISEPSNSEDLCIKDTRRQF